MKQVAKKVEWLEGAVSSGEEGGSVNRRKSWVNGCAEGEI